MKKRNKCWNIETLKDYKFEETLKVLGGTIHTQIAAEQRKSGD